MTPKMDDEDIERMIDIIGDGELTAEAQERLHQEGLWPLYDGLRQTAYAAFVSDNPSETQRCLIRNDFARGSMPQEAPRMRSLSFAMSQGEYDALIALLNSAPDWDIARSLLPKLTGAWTDANIPHQPTEDLVAPLSP